MTSKIQVWEIEIRGQVMTYRIEEVILDNEYVVLLESLDMNTKEWNPLFTFENELSAIEYLTTFKEKHEGLLKTTGKGYENLINKITDKDMDNDNIGLVS